MVLPAAFAAADEPCEVAAELPKGLLPGKLLSAGPG
jgi:hypothetical protein